MTSIPELPPIVLRIIGGEPITGHGSINKCEEADVDPSAEERDVNLAAAAVEFEGPALGDFVCPASMFNRGIYWQSPLCLRCKALVLICW